MGRWLFIACTAIRDRGGLCCLKIVGSWNKGRGSPQEMKGIVGIWFLMIQCSIVLNEHRFRQQGQNGVPGTIFFPPPTKAEWRAWHLFLETPNEGYRSL